MKTKLWFPLNLMRIGIDFLKDVALLFRQKIFESIRLQLMLTFIVCFLASLFIYSISSTFFGEYYKDIQIDYNDGMTQIDAMTRTLVDQLNEYNENHIDRFIDPSQGAGPQAKTDPDAWIQHIIESSPFGYRYTDFKVLILDLEGKVLYKSANATETEVDIHNIIRQAMESRMDRNLYENKEFSSFYPFNFKDKDAYLIVSGVPQANILSTPGTSPFPMLLAFICFILLFYFLTQKKMKYIEELASGLREISKGNLQYRVLIRSRDELGSLAHHINHMTEELQQTINEERNAEKSKNELITNVSHDLRTPLTSIIGYLRLLKDKNFENENQAENYLNIAYTKSEKLKYLLENLFDFTKLSNPDVELHLEKVCLNELLEQLIEELITFVEENHLKLIKAFPTEKLMVSIDADKIIRVFENLLTNAVKYSLKPGELQVIMQKENGYIIVCMINKGEDIHGVELARLFERFYRAETSRSAESGGSGLGLAIAKSIMDLHDGEIWAESDNGEIKFCVKIKLDQ